LLIKSSLLFAGFLLSIVSSTLVEMFGILVDVLFGLLVTVISSLEIILVWFDLFTVSLLSLIVFDLFFFLFRFTLILPAAEEHLDEAFEELVELADEPDELESEPDLDTEDKVDDR